MKKLSFAIVGSGPAGFYVGKCLATMKQAPIVHIFEKEYCPFGLIRYGVAPDHISIKKSENTLSSLGDYQHFSYYGHHTITPSVLTEIKQQYSGVIWAIGAQQDNTPQWFKEAKIAGRRVVSAREVVYWYNYHPEYQQYCLPVQQIKNITIIGNGNVSIDIARILLKPVKQLEHSEINPMALQTLRQSRVRNVTIVGRRGAVQSAFALKQLRQLHSCKIPIYWVQEDLDESWNDASVEQLKTTFITNRVPIVRMNKRKLDFLKDKCQSVKKENLKALLEEPHRKVILRYLLEPKQIGEQKITMARTKLTGEAFSQSAQLTHQEQILSADLIVNSTGFKVNPVSGTLASNHLSHSNGCLIDPFDSQKILPGQFGVGWVKTGPKGVIDQTILSCEETFNNIRIQSDAGHLQPKSAPSFATDTSICFSKYRELRQLQLSRGQGGSLGQLSFRKKLSANEIKQFFGQ